MNASNLIARAQDFAHRAHDAIKQIRKYSGLPYWVHTDEVAATVAYYNGSSEAVAAAHLHDVLEDVAAVIPDGHDYPVIESEFGTPVARLVQELTDEFTSARYPSHNRAWRKEQEARRIMTISPIAQTIKLADLYSNTKSIVDNDPNFAKVYLAEKARILPGLLKGNLVLYGVVLAQLNDSFDKLHIKY